MENETLNAILYHNIQRAKINNIFVALTAEVSPEISISAVDISVIVGNTFDNAIEECSALDNNCRKICVSLIQQNDMLFYEIKNPCIEVPRKKSGNHHGYGLKNTNACVQKYGGTMDTGTNDGCYYVSIRMNCPPGKNAENAKSGL